MKDILEKLKYVDFPFAKWRELAWQLLPNENLDTIEGRYPHPYPRLERVITLWKKKADEPSWQTLAEALSQCSGEAGVTMADDLRFEVGLGKLEHCLRTFI